MPNNILQHGEYGVLDLRLPDLGRPDIPFLWEILRADKRPVPQRQLMCGEICFESGSTEWMYLFERDGRRGAAHQSREAERLCGSNESDEHKAYKERTIRVAEAAGHRAEAEVRSSDGKIKTDVLVTGAGGVRIGFETQRSFATEQNILKRDRTAITNGINAAWHTDRIDLARRNEVAWARTFVLSTDAIRDTGHPIKIQGGIQRLVPYRCDGTSPTVCPAKGYGRCGAWHFTSKPIETTYDKYVRGVAAGELVKVAFKLTRRTNNLWVPIADRDRYERERETSASVQVVPKPRRATVAAEGNATCRDRIVLAGAADHLATARFGARLAEVDDFRDVIPMVEALRRSIVTVVPPPRLKTVPRACGDGVTPCGAAARLYPCGWRCDEHSPGAYRRRGAT